MNKAAQSAPKQSAGVWVKASERLPDKRQNCFVKVWTPLQNGYIYNSTRLFDGKTFQREDDVINAFNRDKVIEWLDEGQQLQSQQQSNVAMQGDYSKDEVHPLPPLQQEEFERFAKEAEIENIKFHSALKNVEQQQQQQEDSASYDKGREVEERVFMKFIREWDGKTNSDFGQAMKDTFDRMQVEQQNKLSDEEIEKLGAEYALNEYGYVGQEMHKRDFIKGFKFKACLQKGYNEDKPALTDEQIEQIAEKLYPTPEHPFDKNNFKERIGFIKGLKYNGSEDKIAKALSLTKELMLFTEEDGKPVDGFRFREIVLEMKQFLQSLASK